MSHTVFSRPVRIFVGLGMPREIDNAFQAYAFLSELPKDGRELRAAREACLAAINGLGTVERAREAFVSYADKAMMLVDDLEPAAVPANEAGLAPDLRLVG